jgi:uncharacterized protein YjbJ (UPF0337 family)
MNKDQVRGVVKEAAGKVQKKIGEAIGSAGQQAKGAAKEAEGKAERNVGEAREILKAAHRKP